MSLMQVDLDMAHAVYSVNKGVVMKQFSAQIKFLDLVKTVQIEAATMVEATNKLYVDLVRVVKTQKGATGDDGLSDFLVWVDVAGDHVTMTVRSRNVYESIYNVASGVLEVLSVEEIVPASA